jgi:hypothetical protein
VKIIMRRILLVTSLCLGLSSIADGAVIESTFDTSLEGWSVSSDGSIGFIATGGNPDGHAEFKPFFNTALVNAQAPSAFLGDLSAYDGGIFSFDSVIIGGGGDPNDSFGVLTISNGTMSLSQDLAIGVPGSNWETFNGTFSAAGFEADEATWNSVMANVTSLEISMNAGILAIGSRSYGFDNARLETAVTTVPVVPAGWLFGSGLLGLIGIARRKKA